MRDPTRTLPNGDELLGGRPGDRASRLSRSKPFDPAQGGRLPLNVLCHFTNHHDVREAREAREEYDSRVFFAIIVVFAIFAIGRGPDLTK
jgi:hypothetical protein